MERLCIIPPAAMEACIGAGPIADIGAIGNGKRLRVYKRDGFVCRACGMRGAYFAVEREDGVKRWHLTLYGLDDDGAEVPMTLDHIVPKKSGGKATMGNLQTMCEACNHGKGHVYLAAAGGGAS